MKTYSQGVIHIAALLLVGLALLLITSLLLDVQKQRTQSGAFDTIPANDRAKGLVYDDLEVNKADCPKGFKVKGVNPGDGKKTCTHGPDPAPEGFDINKSVEPVNKTSLNTNSSSNVLGVICDGDGVSGKRVQILYVRASDKPDRYSQFLPSIQQWATDADSNFKQSAKQTGGSRNVRFVHDGACTPVVENVTLTPAGDDTFGATFNELVAQGYSRNDRDYMIFEDANVYCGIGTMPFDDQAGPGNASNTGPYYGRTDAGCWSGVISSHELMHNFGGVQASAPNSDGGGHCNDGYDNMCDHSGHAINIVCPDTAMDSLFDCNHDDYFHTSPASNSYLATHWNTAFNLFLIGIPKYTKIDYIKTQTRSGNNFIETSSFAKNSQVYIEMHLSDQTGGNVSGMTVNYTVKDPTGKEICNAAPTSGSDGKVNSSCKLSKTAASGTWSIHINSLKMASGPSTLGPGSVTDKTFSVQ